MKIRYWLVVVVLGAGPALAWGDDCKFRAERTGNADAAGIHKVVIHTGAGDLKVNGHGGATRIEARGIACAGKQQLLDATQVNVRREGDVVYVETAIPQDEGKGSWGNSAYAYLDLEIALPDNVPVEAIDSSGDAAFEQLAALNLTDSSGDLKLRNIAGALTLTDSSGDLSIDGAGSVKLSDSSGDIQISRVRGDVEVLVDSSGDMRITAVDGSVTVQQDTSGNIHVEQVKGSVTVNADTSGDIYAGHVGGDFTVRQDSSGKIEHGDVGGKISLPPDHDGGRQ
jgi:DUF4097 and DUF4098 domain-containing protein YvlB